MEEFSTIASFAHHWIPCSEWVLPEWFKSGVESKFAIGPNIFSTFLHKNKITGEFQSGLLECYCAHFFLLHDKLITWLSALKGIIAALQCSANIVCDEKNSTFSTVILPTILTDICSFEIGYR